VEFVLDEEETSLTSTSIELVFAIGWDTLEIQGLHGIAVEGIRVGFHPRWRDEGLRVSITG